MITLTNVATVTSDTPDLDASDNTVTVTTPVSPHVDLVLTLQTPTMGVAGQSIWVTATITNSGPSDAQGTVVTITLPAGTSYSYTDLPDGWSDEATVGNTVVLTTANVFTAGTSVEFPMTVYVSPSVTPGTQPGRGGRGRQRNAGDEPARTTADVSETSILASATLTISKSDDPDPVVAGELVTYTITIKNTGSERCTLRGCEGPTAGRLEPGEHHGQRRRCVRRHPVPVRHSIQRRQPHGDGGSARRQRCAGRSDEHCRSRLGRQRGGQPAHRQRDDDRHRLGDPFDYQGGADQPGQCGWHGALPDCRDERGAERRAERRRDGHAAGGHELCRRRCGVHSQRQRHRLRRRHAGGRRKPQPSGSGQCGWHTGRWHQPDELRDGDEPDGDE